VICPGCNQSTRAEFEVERLREALEWIRHQVGVATGDDSNDTMGEVYRAAMEALGDGCDRCGLAVALHYVPEYGANFCERCAANPQGQA
jgi:hypothetical protein